MKEYSSENIINMVLSGHASSGKTMFAEAMLFCAKKIHKMGSIEAGNTISDFRELEKNQQCSISLSLMNVEWQGKKINLIDCPGYPDFQGDMCSATRVADTALIFLNAVNGVQIGTQLAFDAISKDNKKACAFIINMMDRDQAKFNEISKSLKDRFGRGVLPFFFPLNVGENFNQIADVLNKEIILFKADGSGDYTTEKPEGDILSKIEDLHNELIEFIAESDEELLEKYFENGSLSENEINSGLKKAMLNGGLFPLFVCSGQKNIGVKRILDIISNNFPVSNDFGDVDSSKSPSAFIFKTVSEAHVGELSFFKVFSGSLNVGDELQNISKNTSERLRQVFIINGHDKNETQKIIAGDIGAALKLKNTHTCDILCSAKEKANIPGINFPISNVSFAIASKSRGDEDKIATGLSLLHEEDPTFMYKFDPELKQTIISGQGEMHIDLILKKLKSKFSVELLTSQPKVPYRETITSNSNAKYRHKKQSGGAGQFAEVWLRVTPGERGTGIEFKESLVGQNVDRSFVPSVDKGIKAMCEDGIIAGCNVVDLSIDFYDGKMHPVDSNDMAFQIAGKHAFADAFKAARPKLLEPIYKLHVKTPEDYTGDIMGDISQRRGKVSGMDSDGYYQLINAELPLSHLHDYATTLKSITSGEGMFNIEFSHYEDMPHAEASKVIAKYESSRESE